MLCLSGFELHSRWVPLNDVKLETSKKFGLDKTGTTCPVRKKKMNNRANLCFSFLIEIIKPTKFVFVS